MAIQDGFLTFHLFIFSLPLLLCPLLLFSKFYQRPHALTRRRQRQRRNEKAPAMGNGQTAIPPPPSPPLFGSLGTRAHAPTWFSAQLVQDLNCKVGHMRSSCLNHLPLFFLTFTVVQTLQILTHNNQLNGLKKLNFSPLLWWLAQSR